VYKGDAALGESPFFVSPKQMMLLMLSMAFSCYDGPQGRVDLMGYGEQPPAFMTYRKRLGLPNHLYCDPLRGSPGRMGRFDWIREVSARNAIRMRERMLDAAFLTPIDYARESSLYYIVPRVVVASQKGDRSVSLHFRGGVKKIATVAIDPSSVSEIILAQIILAEQFDIHPQFVPYQGTLEEALAKADAALILGDDSIRLAQNKKDFLDLVEEWTDLTGLPYVHGFWTGREHALTADEISGLQQQCADGLELIDEIAATAPREHHLGSLTHSDIRDYLSGLTYEFADDVEEGLKEFFRYAFYHAILPDVPELQYFGASATDEDDDLPAPHPDQPSVH
jgi:chorismate dehydratase